MKRLVLAGCQVSNHHKSIVGGDREYYCTHLPNPKAVGARLFRKRDTLEQLEEAIVESYRKLEEEELAKQN